MSEYYTVSVNNSSGTEITGGRVGNFSIYMPGDSFYIGQSSVNSSDGILFTGGTRHFFNVTSPDSIYVILSNDSSGNIKVFHNR